MEMEGMLGSFFYEYKMPPGSNCDGRLKDDCPCMTIF
jgi:hypothetical protein